MKIDFVVAAERGIHMEVHVDGCYPCQRANSASSPGRFMQLFMVRQFCAKYFRPVWSVASNIYFIGLERLARWLRRGHRS